MNAMSHKGYTARIEYDNEDRIFVGRIAGTRDIVSFHGTSVNELEKAFREAVEDYLDACEKLGQSPNKTASGRLIKPAKPLTLNNVVATIREGRDSCKISLSK